MDYFKNKVVQKPWGNEYVVYSNKNISITLLNIKRNNSTSLHCHSKKKTGFIILEGEANIQLGLYKSTSEKFKAPSKLMIRPGLFHKISSIGGKKLVALEIETPNDKFDLVRFEDKYGRENKTYETKSFTSKDLNRSTLINLNINKNMTYKFNDSRLIIKSFENLKFIKNSIAYKNIFALIKGRIVNKYDKDVLPLGDIVRTGTLKKLSNKFKIKNKATFLIIRK